MIGKLHYWVNPNPNEYSVLNFPTKNYWRAPSNLSYVRLGLIEFQKLYRGDIDSIAFPMLGCGLGGLDRGEVKEIMSEYLSELKDLRVEIYLR